MKNYMNYSVKIFTMIFVLFFSYSCQKEEAKPAKIYSIISTSEIINITQNSAECIGNITSAGSSPITARGTCWSKFNNPTTDNDKTIDSSGIGSFTSYLTSLTSNTTYFVRAYCINSLGNTYGNQIVFKTDEAPPVSPCSPKKNTLLYNSQTHYYSRAFAGTSGLTYGNYGVSAGGAESDIEIEFSEEPKSGKYIIARDIDIAKGECIVHGVFGGLFSYHYFGKSGATVYVTKNAPGKYSITFCNLLFSSASTSFVFYSDCNLTSE